MLRISNNVSVPLEEIQLQGIRAQGNGGQNVNKVSSAIHLRFDILRSSLPDWYKTRLLSLKNQKITKEGIVVIKAQQHRTQEKNKKAALERLQLLIQSISIVSKNRKSTMPTRSSVKKRLDTKSKQSEKKSFRKRVEY
jgi:ribosome-associated protein